MEPEEKIIRSSADLHLSSAVLRHLGARNGDILIIREGEGDGEIVVKKKKVVEEDG